MNNSINENTRLISEVHHLARETRNEISIVRDRVLESEGTAESDSADSAVRGNEETAMERESVDLISYQGYGVFAFQNDQLYDMLPEGSLNQNVEDYSPEHFLQSPARAPVTAFQRLLAAVSATSEDLTFFDIGAHWGLVSIEAADILKGRDKPWRVVSFEPGPTSRLIEATVELNGMAEFIEVRDVGVLDRTGPGLFYQAEGYTNANSLTRHIHHKYASLVYTVDIREIIREFDQSDGLFAKIDIEGMEPQIVAAMRPVFDSKPVGMCIEISHGPPSEETVANMRTFHETHHLIEARSDSYIEPSGFSQLADSLIDMPGGFTDLVCVPRHSAVEKEIGL